MRAQFRNTALAIVAGCLCGCELIAGIQDLQEGPAPADADGGLPTGDGSPYGSRDGASSTLDARSGNASDATFDAMFDATARDSAPSDDAPSDAPSPDDGGSAADASIDGGVDGNLPNDAAPEAAIDGSSAPPTLIDDMESTGVPPGWLDGPDTDGTWYVFDDGTAGGVISPTPAATAGAIISVIPGGRGTSAHAAHVSGNAGFTQYGAGMGFNLNSPSSVPGTFDASAHAGFTFFARALGDGGAPPIVTFNVIDEDTALPASGGNCDGGTLCGGYYGVALTNLSSSWQEFTVHYSDLKRPKGVPTGPALDKAHIIGCEFQVNQGYAFDLWIDDIYFIDQ